VKGEGASMEPKQNGGLPWGLKWALKRSFLRGDNLKRKRKIQGEGKN